tara:strand:- start:585 stop:1115 length:531 start_codon:yes stop_codon:yes gene_type:complete
MPESNMLDIIQGIAQAAANVKAIGGSTYKGRALEQDIGLRRNEEISITDKRVHDGFYVKFGDNLLTIGYQSDIQLKELHDAGKFEDEMENVMKEIVSFLKKEYKTITKNSLSLTPDTDIDVLVQSASNVRSFVNVSKVYKIGGVDSTAEEERTIDAKFQKFLEQGGWKGASDNGND